MLITQCSQLPILEVVEFCGGVAITFVPSVSIIIFAFSRGTSGIFSLVSILISLFVTILINPFVTIFVTILVIFFLGIGVYGGT